MPRLRVTVIMSTILCILLQVAVAACSRHFDLTLTWETGAPDGIQRDVFKINGQFPGPTLEVNEGEDVVVKVRNSSPFNTSVHYHGIEMVGTPWSDGVPGLSQSHIRPGCKFTYRWKASQHGAFYYHAHSQSQANDGLYGPLIIHPASSTATPYALITNSSRSQAAITAAEKKRIPLLLSDWRHVTSMDEWASSQQTGMETPCFDSILINGKGRVQCSSKDERDKLITDAQKAILGIVPGAELTDKSCLPPEVIAAFAPSPPDFDAIPRSFFYGCNVTQGSSEAIHITQKAAEEETWVMFDLIGAFASQTVQVSFDELPMFVIAADGNDIEPQAANSLMITNGERYTVVIRLQKPKKYTLRVSGVAASQLLWTTAELDFKIHGQNQSLTPSVPYITEVGANTTADVVFFDVDKTKPYPPQPVPQTVDATFKMTMTIGSEAIYWAFNQTILPENTEDLPPLLFAPQPNRQDNHTITVPSKHSWVDYIMLTPGSGPTHPIHVHGRHFYVLGRGTGNFTWATVEEASAAMPEAFNLVDPPLRDTFATLGAPDSWLALRRPSDNPGVWLMHCHIQSHLQGGMSVIIEDGLDGLPKIPDEYLHAQC